MHKDMGKGLREQLRSEIKEQVRQERIAAWQAELEADAKRKTPLLDHDREEPDIVAPWNNMAPEAEAPLPGIAQMLQHEQRNELGDAELLQSRQAGKFCFDHSAGKEGAWYRWNGVVWEPDEVAQAEKLPMGMLADMYEESAEQLSSQLKEEQEIAEAKRDKYEAELAAAEQSGDMDKIDGLKTLIKRTEQDFQRLSGSLGGKRKRLIERTRQLRGKRRASSVMRVAASGDGSLGISGREWEQHPLLFACANGVVDLETGRLMRGRPEWYQKNASPVPYIGLWEYSDWWESHLEKVFCGDWRLREYFEMAVGYSVTGIRVNKDFWCAYGPKADNGKSGTFNPIKTVLGDYGTTIKVNLLLDEGREQSGPDPDMMVIDGLRMGVASEATEKAKFSIEKLKAITGGDDVRARGMYADSKIIQSYCKLWLHTNSIPKLSGYDPGFKLRLKVIPFLATFTRNDDEVDEAKHVYKALNKAELDHLQKVNEPYILAWVLRCSRNFLRNMNYKTPDVVKQYTEGYFEEEDIIGQFLSHCCYNEPGAKTQAKNLYKAFKKFCVEELGIPEGKVKSQIMLGKDLKTRYERDESNFHRYVGLALKNEWSDLP